MSVAHSHDHNHGHGHGKVTLPVVSYSIVDPDASFPPSVHDKLAESFGFNSGTEWGNGKELDTVTGSASRYLRWLQPMESDLARQVEYDMDEQDQIWLDNVNKERAKEGQAKVSYEMFEIIFDKLEKEWFDLTKMIPKKPSALPTEDSKCAICDDGECENSNAIVFCDGCNLAVHQDCYGVPYIPEGQWLCRKCTVSPDKPVTCVLCPNSYGAFKQTTTSQWAHLLCAIWIPDTGVSNTVYMEPIDGIEAISKDRWKLICYLCRKRVGACIQCANRSCFTAFHVSCQRERGGDLKMKLGGGERGELRAFCEKHSEDYVPPAPLPGASPVPEKRSHKKKVPLADPVPSFTPSSRGPTSLTLTLKSGNLSSTLTTTSIATSTKSARAYKKKYSSGPPVVPEYVYARVMAYLGKVKMARKGAFVSLVCRYWSLKREARRGAPLLKRLHLEPWTASATSQQQTDTEKSQKLHLARLLRNDLEKVRMLTERLRKREKKKLERAVLLKSFVDEFVFGKEARMKDVLERIALLDKQKIFAKPVSKIQVPDYYDIIKHPMDWQTMGEKLERHEYLTTQDFQDDVALVINNARRYNQKDTHVHRSAARLSEAAEPILAELEFVDAPDSEAFLLSSAITSLLTPKVIDELFEFHYDPPPPPPLKPTVSAAKMILNKGKGKEGVGHEGDHGAESAAPLSGSVSTSTESRKRKASEAGLSTGNTPRASRPRTSDMMLIEEAASATPLASTRINAREAARLRAESAALEDEGKATGKVGVGKTKFVKEGEGEVEPSGSLPVMDVVNPRDTFKYFETGWVLPEGSSRRRSIIPSAAPATPIASTSKARANPPSTASTVPPLRPTASATPIARVPSSRSSRKGKEKANETLAPADLLPSAPGTRASSSELSELMVDTVEGEPEPMEVDDAEGDAAVAGEGAEEGEERSRGGAVSSAPPTPHINSKAQVAEWRRHWAQESPGVAVSSQDQVADGTLVWARIAGFPYWPAEVADPKDPETPSEFLAKTPKENLENYVLVLFYDDIGSGAWIPMKDAYLLGESPAFDKLCMSSAAVMARGGTKWKRSRISKHVNDLSEAYTRAVQNMEVAEAASSSTTTTASKTARSSARQNRRG